MYKLNKTRKETRWQRRVTDEGKREIRWGVRERLRSAGGRQETVTGSLTVHGNILLQAWTDCWSKCTRLGYFAVKKFCQGRIPHGPPDSGCLA